MLPAPALAARVPPVSTAAIAEARSAAASRRPTALSPMLPGSVVGSRSPDEGATRAIASSESRTMMRFLGVARLAPLEGTVPVQASSPGLANCEENCTAPDANREWEGWLTMTSQLR